MTEDYKKGILDYISGNITPESKGVNSFRTEEVIDNDLLDRLTALGITPSFSTKTLLSETNSNIIIYDSYSKNSKTYSFIAILNQNGEVLDILTTYESGMPIEEIYELNYDENGNIYGIDMPWDQGNYGYYRIVLFNNITVPIGNKYVCKLRSSYYIRTDFNIASTLNSKTIKKIPGEAKYYLFGYETSGADNKMKLIEFSNVVGAPLEWNYYIGQNIGNSYLMTGDFIINTQGEKNQINFYYHLDTDGGVVNHEYFDGEKLILKSNITTPNIVRDMKVLNSNELYTVSSVNNGDSTYSIIAYKITNEAVNEIFTYNVIGNYPLIYISVVDGILFCKTENSENTGSITYKVKCGVYYDDTVVISPSYEFSDTTIIRTACNVQKAFDLYSFIVLCQNKMRKPKIVIYDNQYSGASYKDYSITLPSHCEIYSNGYIKFARDLYNRQVYQNQCLSTANVPFNYLNDMEISPSNLIGASMTTLVSDNTQFEKNKYENLFINFMNKITVLDEDTDTLYQNTASYINENINTANKRNYEDTFIGKVQINFSTPQVQNIEWNWDTDHYVSEFVIYTSEIPTSIEYKSKDESTTYLIKELSNLSENKYYKISQKLRIE